MKNANIITSITIATLLSILVLYFIDISTSKHESANNIIVETVERAYFEGQRDALNNDIRIIKVNDSCYTWSKSPWDDKKETIFNPLTDCKK